MTRSLDAREFKMLLDPARFPDQSIAEANGFWQSHLKPLVERVLGASSGKGEFVRERSRTIHFRDTNTCLLTGSNLNLRQRQQDGEGEELTLKLRRPASERERVAGTDMPGSGDGVEIEFEEDIGPGGSRFALSTSVGSDWGDGTYALADLQSVFPTILDLVAASDGIDHTSLLEKGPRVRERVLDKAKAELAPDVNAKFDLTFWTIESNPPKRIVELSFSYEIEGPIDAAAASAATLFAAMQSQLPGWVNATQSGKTERALPLQCRNS
jgi:hypothetical protein